MSTKDRRRHPRRQEHQPRFGGVKALTDILQRQRARDPLHHRPQRRLARAHAQLHQRGVHAVRRLHHLPGQDVLTITNSRQVAEMGIGRTFQNLALFKGMSVIDNIMTGRNLKIKSNLLLQALRIGPAEREEIRHREYVEHIIDFLEIQAFRKTPVGQLPYGPQKRVDLGRALAMEPQVLLLDEPMAGMNVEESRTCAASS